MLTRHYIRALFIAAIVFGVHNTLSFAQGNTMPLKPLSVGTVTLYYNEYVWNGWNTYRNGPGTYKTDYYDWKGKGYYFTKVTGDTVINGKQYAIIHNSATYTNSTENLWVGDLFYSDSKGIAYERQTDSALFQIFPGYNSQSQKTDFEKEIFNIKTNQCAYLTFYTGSCTTQSDVDTFTISCYRSPSDFSTGSVTIKKGLGIVLIADSYSSHSLSSRSYYSGKTRFIGALSDGKVLGDSLVLFLDTDLNTLDTLRKQKKPLSYSFDNNLLNIRSYITDNVLSLKLYTDTAQDITIEVFSTLGQLAYRIESEKIKKYYSQVDLNVGYLPPGLYFIRVYSKEGISTSKILVGN